MIRDWSIVLWPLGICLLACLMLIGERLWPRRGDLASQHLGRERDLHVRTVAAAVMGFAIAAVAFSFNISRRDRYASRRARGVGCGYAHNRGFGGFAPRLVLKAGRAIRCRSHRTIAPLPGTVRGSVGELRMLVDIGPIVR
jgi:hypothetical protein